MGSVAQPKPALYVFGYGSLLFRPFKDHITSFPGYIRGYYRRLWQISTDHRGTKTRPGRVFTLLPAEDFHKLTSCGGKDGGKIKEENEGIVWGIVYGVSEADKARVLKELDYREKDGYGRRWEDIYDANGKVIAKNALVYASTKELGVPEAGDSPVGWKEIAKVVVGAQGESGVNWEYVEKAKEAVRKLGLVDEHIEGVAKEVMALRAKGGEGES